MIKSVTLQPYVDASDEAVIDIRIHLFANLPPEVVDAVQRNPELALGVRVTGKRHAFDSTLRSDNKYLVKSVDLPSGTIYKLLSTRGSLTYQILLKSFLEGASYWIIIDINENLPGHHRLIVKFRLVGQLFFFSVSLHFEEYLKSEARLYTFNFRQRSKRRHYFHSHVFCSKREEKRRLNF